MGVALPGKPASRAVQLLWPVVTSRLQARAGMSLLNTHGRDGVEAINASFKQLEELDAHSR